MTQLGALTDVVEGWAQQTSAIRAVALVGSYARGAQRPDSDVDLILLAQDPLAFRATGWITQFDWSGLDTDVDRWVDREYGAVWSRHVHLTNGLDVEFSFGELSWAATDPVDPGTRKVMTDGHRVLYDPDGLLAMLITALA
ncbi:MAG: nucleotidyltransferase domain-containing protein [Chloroflexota bacterium]